MPRRLSGGMLRSSRAVSTWAYLGGILLAVPSFTDSTDVNGDVTPGLLSHLPSTLYGNGSFSHGRELTRFSPMLAGPTLLGQHLRKLWRHARQCAWGQGRPQSRIPESSLFAVSVEAAGLIGDSVCAKPQHRITTEVEDRQYHTVGSRN